MASLLQEKSGSRTITENLKKLCLSEKYSDVKFVFGESGGMLHAHRMVLSIRSPVFEAMMYGPMSNDSGGIIKIEDTDPDTFAAFLRFIYSDEIELDNDLVLKMLYLANKYDLAMLEDKCCSFLNDNMDDDNVCTIHEHAATFNKTELKKKCFDFIAINIQDVVKSEAFLSISLATLGKLLEENHLSVDESELFHAAIRWAKQQCKKNNVVDTGVNIRQQLGEHFYNIRFPTMPMHIFAQEVCPAQVLTTEEENQLFRYLATQRPDTESDNNDDDDDDDDDDDEDYDEMVGSFTTRKRWSREIYVVLGEHGNELEGSQSKRRRHSQRISSCRTRLYINPIQRVSLHSIYCKSEDVVTSISKVTVSHWTFSDDDNENDTGHWKDVEDVEYEGYEREKQIYFDPAIVIDRGAEIFINFHPRLEMEDYDESENVITAGLNLKIKYNPTLLDQVSFSKD